LAAATSEDYLQQHLIRPFQWMNYGLWHVFGHDFLPIPSILSDFNIGINCLVKNVCNSWLLANLFSSWIFEFESQSLPCFHHFLLKIFWNIDNFNKIFATLILFWLDVDRWAKSRILILKKCQTPSSNPLPSSLPRPPMCWLVFIVPPTCQNQTKHYSSIGLGLFDHCQ
jgi:hypothetical protein